MRGVIIEFLIQAAGCSYDFPASFEEIMSIFKVVFLPCTKKATVTVLNFNNLYKLTARDHHLIYACIHYGRTRFNICNSFGVYFSAAHPNNH